MSAGFPCKAFSWLRSGKTQLLEDPEARGRHATMDTIKAGPDKKIYNIYSYPESHACGPAKAIVDSKSEGDFEQHVITRAGNVVIV